LGYHNRIQNGPHDCHGLATAQGSKAKPASQVSAAPIEQSEGRSNTKGGQQLARRAPTEGAQYPQALYLSPAREVSFTPLCVGWYLAILVFPIGITRQHRLKPHDSNLIGGHQPLSCPMERHLPLLALIHVW
jgi:hypothetical protein